VEIIYILIKYVCAMEKLIYVQIRQLRINNYIR
jgi:hypothetical protein